MKGYINIGVDDNNDLVIRFYDPKTLARTEAKSFGPDGFPEMISVVEDQVIKLQNAQDLQEKVDDEA